MTGLVKEQFVIIAKERLKGIVSQAKQNGQRPYWIGEELWNEMWLTWDTPEAISKSSICSDNRNSSRGGVGAHKHVSGQKSYLTRQIEMEKELGRPVSFAEVFVRTHTLPDGTFVDEKAREIVTTYELILEDVMRNKEVNGTENLEMASDASTLTIDEHNEIFLKCTKTDSKGNVFGLGQLQDLVKGKGKAYPSSSDSAFHEMQDELRDARAKLLDHDLENIRRDQELQEAQAQLAELQEARTQLGTFKLMFAYLKEKSDFVEYLNQAQTAAATPTTTPNAQGNTAPDPPAATTSPQPPATLS